MVEFPNIEHYKGDTFRAIPMQIKFNGIAIDITNYIITMQLKKEIGGVPYLTLSSIANAGITIVNGIIGIFEINEQIIDIKSGTYIYDIEFNDNNIIDTYIRGSFNIIGDVTNG